MYFYNFLFQIEPAITKRKNSKLKQRKSQGGDKSTNWKICFICSKVLPGEFKLYNHFVACHPDAEPATWPSR